MNDTDVINVTIDRSAHAVLVVDDNPATRYSTGRVLRAAGFKVTEAASGTEAIERAILGVSGVVLDVHLPDIDGFEVCRTLRSSAATQHLPIVHLSATHVANEDRVTGLNAGADAYIVHPAEPAVLVATMQALIRARTAEDQVRRSEQRFRAIYDHAQNGIALIDGAGAVADANPALCRLLGRTIDELRGQPLAALAPEAARSRIQDDLARAAQASSPWHGEFPLSHSGGHAVVLDWTVSQPIEEGLRVAISTDVSDRHELEQRRRELLEREQAARVNAEHYSRTKDDFIAILSHELRTPLNSVIGWVEIMKRRGASPEALKGLEAIERSVKTQARIISDILDVSRINSGKLQLEFDNADPSEVVRNTVASLQQQLAQKKLQLELQVEGAGTAWLDAQRYEQVVSNLLTNAIKFSSPGGRIFVTLDRPGGDLRLTVRDEGQGIPTEFLPRLFDRFTQSDAPGNRRHGGLGLGLSIVKHVVDLHGGRVSAFSAGPGMGTSMQVVMPAARPAPTRSPELADDAAAGRPLEGMDILVVEDDPGAAEMLAVVLSDRGATVRTAGDFDSAMAAAEMAWPSAVVSDIGLPGRDGHELIRALRARPEGRRMPAVALTAFTREQDRLRAIQAGFDAHIPKPLKPLELVSTLVELSAGRLSRA